MPDWLVSRFSPLGLAVVVVQQIPGVIWAIRPPKTDPFAQNSGPLLVEILEKTFGIVTLLLLVVVPARVSLFPESSKVLVASAFVLLASYYVFYVAYYFGVTRLPILLGMAAFPPLSFLVVALHQGNLPAVFTSVAFGAVHVGLTYANFGKAPC